MKKLVIRIAVAFLTFSLGTLVAGLFARKHSMPEVQPSLHVAIPERYKSTRPANEAWRRIKIGHVSFAIPASLKKTGSPGNVGVVEAFGGPFVGQYGFYIYYAYGQRVSSDFNVPTGTVTALIIDGRPAKLYTYEKDERNMTSWKDQSQMELIVSDVGDGRTKFEIYCAGFDLDLMKAIIQTVQIR